MFYVVRQKNRNFASLFGVVRALVRHMSVMRICKANQKTGENQRE